MRRHGLVVVALNLAALASASPRIQLESVDVRGLPELRMTFQVVDSEGAPIAGLAPGGFRFSVAGRPVPELAVSPMDPAPDTVVGIVLEDSERLRGRDAYLCRKFIDELAARLGPSSKIGVWAASESPRLLLDPTSDRSLLRQAFESPASSSAPIRLNTALLACLRELRGMPQPRRSILVLAGSEPWADPELQASVLEQAQGAGIPLHVVAASLRFEGGLLARYANLTAGRYYPEPLPENAQDLVRRWISPGAGRYRAIVQIQGALDSRPRHALLELLDGEGSAQAGFSFQMSSGNGLAQERIEEYEHRFGARQSWWMVYFGAISGGLLLVRIRDRLGLLSPIARILMLWIGLGVGGLVGFVISRVSG